MNCPKCQKVLPDEALFCSSCGSATTKDLRGLETIKQTATTNDQHGEENPTDDPRLGLILDSKYQLIERLGAGGMGSVYRARRLHIGDEVAVKLLSRDLVRNANAIERFRREARSAAMIRHPNVVSIHDFNDAHGNNEEAYIVMELVTGESLRKLLEHEGRLSPERAVSLMRDVCAGVGIAHRQGLLHRDLKPDNVIVVPPAHTGERETAKVVDFGLAKVRDAANVPALTQTGTLLGTLFYMSPEQCRGEDLDARADVYSLGAMLYEMLFGRPPFVSNNAAALIAKHLTEEPPAFPQTLRIPPALAHACLRALAKNREQRQIDAISFGEDLQAALHTSVESAASKQRTLITSPRSKGDGSQTRQSSSGMKWAIGSIALLVLALGLIAVGVAIKFGLDRIGNDKRQQNSANKTNKEPAPTRETESVAAVTASDLRGTWTGNYGPLGQPATLVITSQKGTVLEGHLEQGPVSVEFSGTVASGSIHLKQTKLLSGEDWSLGEDQGTVSGDGKSMFGTGKDAVSGSLGISYQWSFTRK